MLFGIFVYLDKGNRIRSEQTLVCVFADRRKNSPVDCFAGGSKEAIPRFLFVYFACVNRGESPRPTFDGQPLTD
jgi:hypothetical protein